MRLAQVPLGATGRSEDGVGDLVVSSANTRELPVENEAGRGSHPQAVERAEVRVPQNDPNDAYEVTRPDQSVQRSIGAAGSLSVGRFNLSSIDLNLASCRIGSKASH